MECLKDFIGIRGCSAIPAPISGRYINQLAGIPLSSIDAVANDEQTTFVGVWNDVQNNSVLSFRTLIINAFRNHKKYRIKSIAEQIDFGRLIRPTVTTPAAPAWRGFTIELSFNSNFIKSSLQQIYVQTVSIYTKNVTANLQVRFFDLDSGKILFTKTVATTIAGWNEINVYERFNCNRIFIAYDATVIDGVEQQLLKSTVDACSTCIGKIYGDYCSPYIYGATSADLANPTILGKAENTYGVTAIASVQCSYEWVVCSNKEHFSEAWMYSLATELMTERLFSDRLNRYTTVERKKAEELYTFYADKLEQAVLNAVDGLDISLSDCCLECNPQIKYQHGI